VFGSNCGSGPIASDRRDYVGWTRDFIRLSGAAPPRWAQRRAGVLKYLSNECNSRGANSAKRSWPGIVYDSLLKASAVEPLVQETEELIRIFSTSIRTASRSVSALNVEVGR